MSEFQECSSSCCTPPMDMASQAMAKDTYEQVVSDNGPQFIADEFATFMSSNGVKHIRSAPYHPASNGAVERFIQTFKQSMRAGDRGSTNLTLHHRIANFLLTYRSTPHATTNQSPASLFLQRQLRTRFSLITPSIERRVHSKQAEQKSQHDKHTKIRQFQMDQPVMVRSYRPGPKWIPGTIRKQLGPVTYLVEVAPNAIFKRHMDQLRHTATIPAVCSSSTPLQAGTDCGSDIYLPVTHADTPPPADRPPDNHQPIPRYPHRVRHPPERLMY